MLADVVGDPTGDVDVAVVQQCAVADDNFVAIGMAGDNAFTSDHVEIVRIGNRLEAGVRIVRLGDRRRPTVRRSSRALAGRVDDGVGEVVFALLLGGRREREDLVISNAEPSTSATVLSPFVSVPVLSKATRSILLARSRCSPPFISTPDRAALPMAETMLTGGPMTSARPDSR